MILVLLLVVMPLVQEANAKCVRISRTCRGWKKFIGIGCNNGFKATTRCGNVYGYYSGNRCCIGGLGRVTWKKRCYRSGHKKCSCNIVEWEETKSNSVSTTTKTIQEKEKGRRNRKHVKSRVHVSLTLTEVACLKGTYPSATPRGMRALARASAPPEGQRSPNLL